MPTIKKFRTNYPGVRYIIGTARGSNKSEKIFYIQYYRDGKRIEEKAGRQFQDGMTAAKAARTRVERIEGKQLTNKARREFKITEKNVWTILRIWEEYKANHALTKGLMSDRSRFSLYINPSLGNKQLKDLAPLDMDRLRINLLKIKKPQTVKHVLELVKRLSNFAINKRLSPGIDFKIQMPVVNNLKTEYLNEGQLSNLLKVISEDTHPYAGKMMLMALYTGMRRGEMLKLQWRDIDFDRGFIHIKNPKGGIDQKIPLNDATKSILESLPSDDSPFVFPGRGGKQRIGISWHLSKIKAKAGLPKDFRPLHGLRHHYASMLASSGKVDMYVLQKLLTHKSPIMTQRYAHLRDEALKRASNLAGELVNQIVKKKEENVINLEVRKE